MSDSKKTVSDDKKRVKRKRVSNPATPGRYVLC